MSKIELFTGKTRITTTPTQLMLAVLSYASKVKTNESKAVMRKTRRKTVARAFGVIRLISNAKQCLTDAEG